jgi:hypothetical protein
MAHTQHGSTEKFLIDAQAGRVEELSGVLLAEFGGRNHPFLLRMRDVEREADILGKQTTKTWVNNTVK